MTESGRGPALTPFMKAILKRIPGLATGVRGLRAALRRIRIAVTARVIAWGTATLTRRQLAFEALSDRLILAVHPQESYVIDASDRVIGRSLYARGEFDFQKFETACGLIRSHSRVGPDAVLIDVGANCGSICIPAVRRGLVQRAIAFELDPGNTRLLRINALLNGVEERIEIHNKAVGAEQGKVIVQHNASNFGDHRVSAAACASGVSVPMVLLDSLADELDLARSILWMDIQGYEAFALQGGRRFLKVGVPLIAEFAPAELDSTESLDTFISLICASHYSVFWDLNSSLLEAAPLNRVALEVLSDRLKRQGTFTDLLFLPPLGCLKTFQQTERNPSP